MGDQRERAFARATLSATGSFVALALALALLVIGVALVNETITIRVARPGGGSDFVDVSCGSAFEVVTGGVRDTAPSFAIGECESVAKRRFWFSSGLGLVALILGALGVWGLARSRRGLGALRTGDTEAVSVTST